MLRFAQGIGIALLLVMAVLGLRRDDDIETAPEFVVDMAAQRSDYYLESFIIRTFDAAGLLAREVTGDTLTHYPASNTARIEPVAVVIHRSPAPDWHISAVHGDMRSDSRQMRLLGDVLIKRDTIDSEQALRVETRSLNLDADLQTFASADPTQMTSAHWHSSGVGLSGDAKSGELRLLDQVKIIYEHPR
ncbi:MAG: LPS export ABC transporter periplasmic protein LptC [Pseudomonadota bacterium]